MTTTKKLKTNSTTTCKAEPTRAILLELPIEVHACIVQYLVLADDLQDLLSLSQTCKALYSDLWSPSSVIWPYIWTVLYGNYSGEAEECTRVETSSFKTAILSRAGLFNDVKRCCRFLIDPMLYCDTTSADEMRSQILRLLAVGVNYDDRSLYWIASSTNSEFWALAVSFWFEMPLQSSSCMYYSPKTLQNVFDIVARLSVKDPHFLQAFYRDDYECFQHIRRTLFSQEMPSPQWQYGVELAPQTWFPWSMCQVFFLVLFCGPTVCAIDAKAQTRKLSEQLLLQQQEMFWWDSISCSSDSDDSTSSTLTTSSSTTSSTATTIVSIETTEPRKFEPLVPSWFNLGLSSKDFTPIPLIGLPNQPPSRKLRQQSQRFKDKDEYSLAGTWAGYYAYRDFDPDVEQESDDEDDDGDDKSNDESFEGSRERSQTSLINRPPRELEHSVRGLRLDRRMDLEIVSWTTKSKEGGCDRSRGDDDCPLYLHNMKDLQAMQEVDRCFLTTKACCSGGDASAVPITRGAIEEDCDDLNQSSNWSHQRIFSGRGDDAIGNYGVRGILSEKTGLVRMVKNYFHHPNEQPCHPFPDPGISGSFEDKRSLYLEFGSGADQLSFDLSTGDMIVYYRGLMEQGGPGILGLWFDEEISGPFWLYTVSASI